MTNSDRREFTLVVLGRPGEAARRYRLRRSTIGALTIVALGVPCASAALGYVLGSRDTVHAAETAAADDPADESTGAVAALALARASDARVLPDEAAIAAAEPAAHAQAEAAHAHAEAVPAHAQTVPTDEAEAGQQEPALDPAAVDAPDEATGERLRILRDAQSEDELVVHPFAPDGSAREHDFAILEAALACGGGRSQRPDPALVRLLLAVQQNFAKPLIIIGGRCASHDDHADAESFHRSGRGADIRLRGVSTERLMAWLVERGSGGAGRYKRAGFVHVDVRPGTPVRWEAEERRAQRKRPQPGQDEGASGDEPGQESAAEPAPQAEPAAADDAPSPDTDSPDARAPARQREPEVTAQVEVAADAE